MSGQHCEGDCEGGSTSPVEPDPEGRVIADPGRLLRLEHAVALNTAVVGPRIRVPRGSLRLHVVLRPRPGSTWPVDADPPVLWLEPGDTNTQWWLVSVEKNCAAILSVDETAVG